MNTYGKLFSVTIYGESHQEAIGVVVSGVMPGIKLDFDKINEDLDKRRPGAVGTTSRIESDQFKVTSGIFNGYTTGSPIHVTIENSDVKSSDYTHLMMHPRPSHADYVAKVKYHGFNDYRGGGRFSGRVTAGLVIAGAIAKQMVPFKFSHEIIQVGSLTDLSKLDQYLAEIKEQNDSVGGIIRLTVKDVPVGLGEPFFNRLDAEIGKMMLTIPAVKGVSIGTGFDGVNLLGSQFNDIIIGRDGKTKTNHSGGISGGISNGNDIVVNAFVKPTSSIGITQESYHFGDDMIKPLAVSGRHDVAIVRRIGIVLENALAIVLADLNLIYKAYKK